MMHHENDKNELLTLAKNEKNVKQKKRYDVVLLFLEGYIPKEISNVLHIPRRTVDTYIHAYKKDGLSALTIKKQPGQSRKLLPEQEIELFHIISTSTPEQEGLGPFANWTSALACRLVKEKYDVSFKDRSMRAIFHRINLSYTRPTYTLKKSNPEKQSEFRERFEGLKKTPK